ncbi:hypothetical protein Y032_0332g2757 [Ancylostoma ceylanicum]|uniref:Uncharacterized protein n=1 Tax=Ancylostoma ceylanicum TaxID=53326 RepID=A0A016RZW8_9BILA|nr:hypothetical protein Y032_0332g2757 [Ancylostoma ceylanicum]
MRIPVMAFSASGISRFRAKIHPASGYRSTQNRELSTPTTSYLKKRLMIAEKKGPKFKNCRTLEKNFCLILKAITESCIRLERANLSLFSRSVSSEEGSQLRSRRARRSPYFCASVFFSQIKQPSLSFLMNLCSPSLMTNYGIVTPPVDAWRPLSFTLPTCGFLTNLHFYVPVLTTIPPMH